MHLNLPVPDEAAAAAIKMQEDDESFPTYPWPAVSIIAAAELDRLAHAVEATVNYDRRTPRPDGYTQGWDDRKTVLFDSLRSRAALPDETHPGEPARL
jgi:hypothetical protein